MDSRGNRSDIFIYSAFQRTPNLVYLPVVIRLRLIAALVDHLGLHQGFTRQDQRIKKLRSLRSSTSYGYGWSEPANLII